MVQKFLRFLNGEIAGIHQAAYLLGLFAICSQLVALVRDKLLAHTFGASSDLDIYYAAFRIPDFIFVVIGSLVSMSILVPFLIEKLSKSHEEARRFIDSMFSFFTLIMVTISVLAFFAMPSLGLWLFPGFGAEAQASLTILSRILLLSPLLLGISNLFGSITQSHNKFLVYALAPVLYNFGIVLGILFLYPPFGLVGLAFGVIIGAMLHLAIQLPAIVSTGFLPRFSFRPDLHVVRIIASISLPRTLALSITQITVLALVSFASVIADGSIAVFNLAFNLQSVPLSIIGVSYSLAAFPTLSRLFTEGKKSEFASQIIASARHIIFWSLPFTALFLVLRAHIVRLVFGSGAFDWTDTRLTAAVLGLFALSGVFQGLSLLFVRGFYASNRTKIPFFANVVSGAVLIFLSYRLLLFFSVSESFRSFLEALFRVSDLPGTEILALALGFSIGSALNGLLLWVFFERLSPGFTRGVWRTMLHALSAGVFMGFAAYHALVLSAPFFAIETTLGLLAQSTIAFVSSILVGVAVLLLLGNREIREVWTAVHQKFWKTKALSPDAEVVPL